MCGSPRLFGVGTVRVGLPVLNRRLRNDHSGTGLSPGCCWRGSLYGSGFRGLAQLLGALAFLLTLVNQAKIGHRDLFTHWDRLVWENLAVAASVNLAGFIL